MSESYRQRRAAIKAGEWDLQPMIDRFKRQGRDTTSIERLQKEREVNRE